MYFDEHFKDAQTFDKYGTKLRDVVKDQLQNVLKTSENLNLGQVKFPFQEKIQNTLDFENKTAEIFKKGKAPEELMNLTKETTKQLEDVWNRTYQVAFPVIHFKYPIKWITAEKRVDHWNTTESQVCVKAMQEVEKCSFGNTAHGHAAWNFLQNKGKHAIIFLGGGETAGMEAVHHIEQGTRVTIVPLERKNFYSAFEHCKEE